MKLRLALLASAALLVAALPADGADLPLEAACLDAAAAASPPCGYIVPQLTLDFPDKPLCRAETLGGPIDLSQCLALPPEGGEPVVQEGMLRFSWDITQDGSYPPDAACAQSTATGGTEGCIVITFSGTATNPKWVDVKIEPETIVLDMVAMSSPDNVKVNPETQQVMFLMEAPVKVTFTRTGPGTDDKSVQRIERAQGATQVFLKAKSSASGQYYKEAFGVEEFRFDPCRNGDALSAEVDQCLASTTGSKESPGLGLAALLGALALLAAVVRRN